MILYYSTEFANLPRGNGMLLKFAGLLADNVDEEGMESFRRKLVLVLVYSLIRFIVARSFLELCSIPQMRSVRQKYRTSYIGFWFIRSNTV